MNPMMKRWVSCMGWLALTGIGACAQGSPSKPVEDYEAMATMMEPPCGNGKFDKGLEMCDCPNKATTTQCLAIDLTCDMVKPGSTGMVFCNAKPNCTLDLTRCVMPGALPPAGPPTGGGGTGR